METEFEQRVLCLIQWGPDGTLREAAPFTVLVEIKEFSSAWVFKVRKQSIIVNHRDLVFRSMTINHSISFPQYNDLVSTVESSQPAEVVSQLPGVVYSGSLESIVSVLQLLSLPSSATKSSLPAPHARPLDAKHTQTSHSQSPSRKNKCLKSGWLFKKRDVLSGWTHRFFKVYSGRVEYFVDESAVVPRGVIPLLGADIVDGADQGGGSAGVAVNGSHDHSQLVIEPRHREKAFTLASERTGSSGRRDIQAWVKVLSIASRTAEVKAVHQQQQSDVTPGAVHTPDAASLVLPLPLRGSGSPGGAGDDIPVPTSSSPDTDSHAGSTAAEGGAGTADKGSEVFSGRVRLAVFMVLLAVVLTLASSDAGAAGSGAAACGRLAGFRVLECMAYRFHNLLESITAKAISWQQ